MLETLKLLLAHQYDATLSTLNLCIDRCPEASWDAPVAKLRFCQAAYHTVFCTDLYLQPTGDPEEFTGQPFHLDHAGDFRDYEEMTDRPPALLYGKSFVTDYVRHVRGKAQETVARESAEVLAGPSGFDWRKCSRAELHVYNLRHVQHHAAQLSLRLRLDHGIDIPWVSHAWKEV